MIIKQISVFVENRPGRLAEITSVISESNIDIRALTIADTTHFGILRIIVNDPEKAEKTLKDAGLTVSMTDVLSINITSVPGGLSKAMTILAEKDITVEYLYAFTASSQNAFVILRTEDIEDAAKILKGVGFEAASIAD